MVLKTRVLHTEGCNWRLTWHPMQKSPQMDRRLGHKRPETVRLLEENAGEELLDIRLSDDVTHVSPKAQVTKGKPDRRESRKPGRPTQHRKQPTEAAGKEQEGGAAASRARGRGSGPSLIESSCSITEKTRTAQNGPADLCPKKHRWPAGVCRGAHHHHPRGKWGNSLFCPKSMNCQVVFFCLFFENKRNCQRFF